MTAMTAGSIPYIIAFAYASDFASFPGTKLIAADRIWVPGFMRGDGMAGHPRQVLETSSYYYEDNANPSGVILGKIPLDGTIKFTTDIVDGIPAYLLLGKATADTPAANSWRLQGSINGDVPKLIADVENNLMNDAAKCARQMEDVKCIKGVFHAKKGWLQMDMEFLARVEHLGQPRSTYLPDLRGTHAPKVFYDIRGNSALTLTWHSLNLGKWLVDFNSAVENEIANYTQEDNVAYASVHHVGGRRKYSCPAFKFVQKEDSDLHLHDMHEHVNGSTMSDLVLTVPRRHATDTAVIRWKNVYLKSWEFEPAPAENPGVKSINAIFSEPTDIEFDETLVTAAAAAEPNHAEDYEKA